jgi:predicted PurR-regulated permease PerM
MDFASFITSVVTSFVIFVVLVLVFTWLSRRPGNAPVYYPSVLLRGLDPWEGRRRGTRSPVGWIQDAISASETDVIAAGGVDAAVYLVFLSSGTAHHWLLLCFFFFFCLLFQRLVGTRDLPR